MLITSHLAVTILAGQALSLSTSEFFTALAGGVALDLDHLLVNGKWLSDARVFLRRGITTHGEVNQHSWIQEPLFGSIFGIIAGVAIHYWNPEVRWWIFPAFQGSHIMMDAFMKYDHHPFTPILSKISYRGLIRPNSKIEWLVSFLVLAAVVLWLL